jgi:hypothetical protein
LKLSGFTNLKPRGPLATLGGLVKSSQEYDEKTKMLEEMELTSVVSEEPEDEPDVEQGTQEE